jgi:hypothetical protein
MSKNHRAGFLYRSGRGWSRVRGRASSIATFEAGIQTSIFNRNQGGIAAAEAEALLAGREADHVRLALRQHFAAEFRHYQDSVATLTRYRDILIPKARQAFGMYTENFRQMSAAYPQILASQRNLV